MGAARRLQERAGKGGVHGGNGVTHQETTRPMRSLGGLAGTISF